MKANVCKINNRYQISLKVTSAAKLSLIFNETPVLSHSTSLPIQGINFRPLALFLLRNEFKKYIKLAVNLNRISLKRGFVNINYRRCPDLFNSTSFYFNYVLPSSY